MQYLDLPQRLKAARERSGLQEWQVANALHIETRLITQFENGTRTPFPYILRRMSQIYHCKLD